MIGKFFLVVDDQASLSSIRVDDKPSVICLKFDNCLTQWVSKTVSNAENVGLCPIDSRLRHVIEILV
ncbi:MAG TPA: hypothetical protein DCS88_07575 [Alphaproteobacteria bacterium]|nr:hypothetical protein [Alphaproteobacteria bacterium]